MIVAGAGPAGSMAARLLANRGARVLLLDKQRFPRDKPCGGGVTLRAAALLDIDLSPVIERTIHGARFTLRLGEAFDRRFEQPLTYMTQRSRLDAYLAEQAAAAGAEFRDGVAVREIDPAFNGTSSLKSTVRTDGDTYTAQILIGADGANGLVGRTLGLRPEYEEAVALEGNIPYTPDIPAEWRDVFGLDLGGMTGGYGWVFPKGDHLNVGVGGWKAIVGSQLRGELDRLCRAYGLDPAAMVQLRGHHLPMMRPGTALSAGGALLVGDAAGFVDPLSGEGIYQAIASGIAAGAALDGYLGGETETLAGYQRTVERELLPEVVASQALTEIFHVWPRPFVTLMQRSGRFWNAMSETLTGQRTIEGMVQSTGPLAYALEPLARLARRFNERRYGRR